MNVFWRCFAIYCLFFWDVVTSIRHNDDVIAICVKGTLEAINSIEPDIESLFRMKSINRDHVIALPTVTDTANLTMSEEKPNFAQPLRCSLKLTTCPNCLLSFRYKAPADFVSEPEFRLMPTCSDPTREPCFDLEFLEDRSDSILDLTYRRVSVWDFPERNSFNSTGDSVTIILTIWNIEANSTLMNYIENAFPFTVSSISSDEVIYGTSPDSDVYNQSSIGFFESPRYPEAYPKSIIKKYKLINSNQNGFVRLIFDDFRIHYQSELLIVDSGGTEVFNSRRERRRPPAMISKGNILTVEFHAKDATQTVGFRARYEFVSERQWPEMPNQRDCDEFLDGTGGTITLDGLSHLVNSHVDCIWIVARTPHVSRSFDRIYLKVDEFRVKGVSLRLQVREGMTSTSDRMLLLIDQQSRDQLENRQPKNGLTTSMSMPAYYIRLQGYLMTTTGLEVVYSQYYRWATAVCPGTNEFHCDNSRCIKASLRCDGADNCGDGSDESCQRPLDDFRQSASTFDPSGLVALVVCVVGVLVLLISAIAIVSKLHRTRQDGRIRRQRAVHGPPGVPTYPAELSPSIQTIGDRRFYVVPENQISVIEAPPSYDDALKHPAVPSSHTNRAYVRNDSTEPLHDTATSSQLEINTREPNTSQESHSEAVSTEALPVPCMEHNDDEPCSSRMADERDQRAKEESWV